MPPKRKTEGFSAPTMLRWQKIYLAELKKMVEDGKLYPEHARRVAKGLKYTIKALEDSAVEYKKRKRTTAKEEYEEAMEFFKDA